MSSNNNITTTSAANGTVTPPSTRPETQVINFQVNHDLTVPLMPPLLGRAKKVPGTLLSKSVDIPDGERVMAAVITMSKDKSYNETFMHGKFLTWMKNELYLSLFNDDGLLNEFKKPTFSTFKKGVSDARKLLEELVTHRHSPGQAEDGERFPRHLSDIIKSWIDLKRCAEVSLPKTQS